MITKLDLDLSWIETFEQFIITLHIATRKQSIIQGILY